MLMKRAPTNSGSRALLRISTRKADHLQHVDVLLPGAIYIGHVRHNQAKDG